MYFLKSRPYVFFEVGRINFLKTRPYVFFETRPYVFFEKSAVCIFSQSENQIMPGPNGKILKKCKDWYADLDNHASEFADDAVTEYVFQCSWCKFQVSIITNTVEEAAEEAVLNRNWCIAHDDDQVGVCCPTCKDGDDA